LGRSPEAGEGAMATLGLGGNGSIGVGATLSDADPWGPPTPIGHVGRGAGAAATEGSGSGSGSGEHTAVAGEPAQGDGGAGASSTSGGKTLRDRHSGAPIGATGTSCTGTLAGARDTGDGERRAGTGRDEPQLSTRPPGAKACLLPRALRGATGLPNAEQIQS
jgi:hypothetical protein